MVTLQCTLGNQAVNSTMILYLTQSHYLDTEPTTPSPILIMPSTWLGSNKYQFYKSLVWLDNGFKPTISRTRDQCPTDSVTASDHRRDSQIKHNQFEHSVLLVFPVSLVSQEALTEWSWNPTLQVTRILGWCHSQLSPLHQRPNTLNSHSTDSHMPPDNQTWCDYWHHWHVNCFWNSLVVKLS